MKTDNLEHLQNSVLDVATSYATALGGNCVLHGAVAGAGSNTNTAVLTPGAIIFNGELLLVDAGTYNKTSGQVFVWEKYDDPLLIDPQTYLNGNTPTVHHVYKARLKAQAAVGAGDFAFANPPSFASRLRDKMAALATRVALGLVSPYTGNVFVNRDPFGQITLEGRFTGPAGSSAVITAVPAPQQEIYFMCPNLPVGGTVVIRITIAGQLSILNYSVGTTYNVDLSAVSYKAD